MLYLEISLIELDQHNGRKLYYCNPKSDCEADPPRFVCNHRDKEIDYQ